MYYRTFGSGCQSATWDFAHKNVFLSLADPKAKGPAPSGAGPLLRAMECTTKLRALRERGAQRQQAHGGVERRRVEEQLGGGAETRRLDGEQHLVVLLGGLLGEQGLVDGVGLLGQGLEKGRAHPGQQQRLDLWQWRPGVDLQAGGRGEGSRRMAVGLLGGPGWRAGFLALPTGRWWSGQPGRWWSGQLGQEGRAGHVDRLLAAQIEEYELLIGGLVG